MGCVNIKHNIFSQLSPRGTRFGMIFSKVAIFFLFKVTLPQDCHNIVLYVQVDVECISYYNIPRSFTITIYYFISRNERSKVRIITRGLRITEYSRIPSRTNVWVSCIPRTPDFSQDLKFENVSCASYPDVYIKRMRTRLRRHNHVGDRVPILYRWKEMKMEKPAAIQQSLGVIKKLRKQVNKNILYEKVGGI